MKKINVLKQLLINSSILIGLFACSLSTQAQAQQTTSQAPALAQAQVSTADLQKFAIAIQKLQVIQRNSQVEIARVIQREGLSVKRFKQIYQTQRDLQARKTLVVAQQERQRFELAIAKISQIQNKTQSVMLKAIQDSGLQVQRFNQIFAAIQKNPTLQQRVQQMLRSWSLH